MTWTKTSDQQHHSDFWCKYQSSQDTTDGKKCTTESGETVAKIKCKCT